MPGRTDRFVRVAVLLPLAQLAAMLVLWLLWSDKPVPHGYSLDRMPMLTKFSIGEALASVAIFAIASGALIARRAEAIHAVVMVSLATLLLAGLWLPIAARMWWGRIELASHVAFGPGVIAWVLAPPAIGGVLFTALAFRWPDLLRRLTHTIHCVLVVLALSALLSYFDRADDAGHIFDNFVHVVLAAATVAIGALALLAASMVVADRWARHQLARATLTGVIADRAPVARIEIASWLRGPRATVGAFAVTTARGEVHVPGAALVASMPAGTTQLYRGESMPVLRGGDRVALTGFVDRHSTTLAARSGEAGPCEPDGDHPFRSSSAPLPEGTILVGKPGERPTPSIGYALWRPSLAYLAVLVGIAVPGLIAAALH